MGDQYTLIGFIDLFGVYPNFVFPVFKNNNDWYFQVGSKDHIDDFITVKESARSRLIPLNSEKNGFIITKYSHPIYAFMNIDGEVVYGNSTYFKYFFAHYKTADNLLRKKISDFLYEISQEKPVQQNSIFTPAHPEFYGTGRRKSSVARVYIIPNGNGTIIVNGRNIDEYFGLEAHKYIVRQPLVTTGTIDSVDIRVTVTGGGVSGQAGAIRHGIARALVDQNDDYRAVLKAAGFLTRDPRMKERKKYGYKAARRAPQFSKR